MPRLRVQGVAAAGCAASRGVLLWQAGQGGTATSAIGTHPVDLDGCVQLVAEGDDAGYLQR